MLLLCYSPPILSIRKANKCQHLCPLVITYLHPPQPPLLSALSERLFLFLFKANSYTCAAPVLF